MPAEEDKEGEVFCYPSDQIFLSYSDAINSRAAWIQNYLEQVNRNQWDL